MVKRGKRRGNYEYGENVETQKKGGKVNTAEKGKGFCPTQRVGRS